MSSLYSKLQSEYCRVVTKLKESLSQKFSWEISKLSQSIIFRDIFICAEEAINMKGYKKTRC